MRKLIASINVTLDGFCDHNVMIADDELHENVNNLFQLCDTGILGRRTYELMESAWPSIVKNPTGNKPIDEFAILIDNIRKIVFSRTLKSVSWENSELAQGDLEAEVAALKKQPGKNILVGGPSMIVQLMNSGLIDEYQFYIHPIVLGTGLPLFKDIFGRIDLKLLNTKIFRSGVVVHYYEQIPARNL